MENSLRSLDIQESTSEDEVAAITATSREGEAAVTATSKEGESAITATSKEGEAAITAASEGEAAITATTSRRRTDIFVGIDVFGRGCLGGGGTSEAATFEFTELLALILNIK